MTKDNVNSPSHYTEGRAFEVIEVLEDWCGRAPDPVLGGLQWQSLKYLGRAWDKTNPLEDLKKSRWYLNRLIDKLEAKEVVQPRVTYEDVLEAATAEAAAGQELLSEYGIADVDDQPLDDWYWDWDEDRKEVVDRPAVNALKGDVHWDEDEDRKQVIARSITNAIKGYEDASDLDWEDFWTGWDESAGPTEVTLSEYEIDQILRNRNIVDADPDEIVKVIEKRGFLLGVKANGNTCVLNDLGKCE